MIFQNKMLVTDFISEKDSGFSLEDLYLNMKNSNKNPGNQENKMSFLLNLKAT